MLWGLPPDGGAANWPDWTRNFSGLLKRMTTARKQAKKF